MIKRKRHCDIKFHLNVDVIQKRAELGHKFVWTRLFHTRFWKHCFQQHHETNVRNQYLLQLCSWSMSNAPGPLPNHSVRSLLSIHVVYWEDMGGSLQFRYSMQFQSALPRTGSPLKTMKLPPIYTPPHKAVIARQVHAKSDHLTHAWITCSVGDNNRSLVSIACQLQHIYINATKTSPHSHEKQSQNYPMRANLNEAFQLPPLTQICLR
jgi:hypothetical protein